MAALLKEIEDKPPSSLMGLGDYFVELSLLEGMMGHAKRSDDFLLEVARFSEFLEDLATAITNGEMLDVDGPQILREIARIVRTHTTDSPCVVKAADGEPIFTLRGQDETAPFHVAQWAQHVRQRAANTTDPEAARRLIDRAMDALACAGEMREWPTRKLPD